MTHALRYAVVTPVRDEAQNLGRLAASLAEQSVPPARWVVVDTGSSDETISVAWALAGELPFVQVAAAPDDLADPTRGAPIVRAFEHGVGLLDLAPDVIVKVDADVSFPPDYFSRLLDAFSADPSLGIASGGAEELDGDGWRRRYATGQSVWGAARAYRRPCLEAVRPLEASMGWDGIDEAKAQLAGWTTRTLPDLIFRHHRLEGERDGRRWRAWAARGRASHYMGYRAWYLGLRALHHARSEPAALALVWGYAVAAIRGETVCADEALRSHLRRNQSVKTLRSRRREAIGA